MNTKLNETVQPWYRSPWPWILMAGPVIVIVAGVITTYLAISSNDGLVDDDYYKQGLAVNQTTARIRNAISLGLQAELMQNAEGTRIRILLSGKPDTVLPDVLKLRITHPTRAGFDQNVRLETDGSGFYSGVLSARLAGRWHIALEDEKREWRLTGEWIIEGTESLRLPAELQGVTGPGMRTDTRRNE